MLIALIKSNTQVIIPDLISPLRRNKTKTDDQKQEENGGVILLRQKTKRSNSHGRVSAVRLKECETARGAEKSAAD